MPNSKHTMPLNRHRSHLTADAFAEYCSSERERRRNRGEGFDPQLFDQAVELVLRSLRGPEYEPEQEPRP